MNRDIVKKSGLILGPLAFLVIYFLISIDGLSDGGKAIMASTTWIAIWWLTEAIPIQTTALLPIVLFPVFGGLDLKSTTFPYAHPLIFLFLGGFMIALAMEKWELHKRIALNIVVRIGTNPSRIILGFMLATGFLSMWISNTATTLMMMPIGISLIENVKEQKNFSKALMLCIAYSASIGGMATLIGTPPNLVFAGVVKETFNVEISFLEWTKLAMPFSITLLFISWYYISHIAFPIKNQNSGASKELSEKLKSLGPMSKEERKVLLVFTIIAASWIGRTFIINQFLPQVSDTIIAVIGGILLFLIPSSSRGKALLDWEYMSKIPWGILILFGAGLSIAAGFVQTDLATWVGSRLNYFDGFAIIVLIVLIVSFVNFLTEFTTNIATASMVLPILAALSVNMGIHPYTLMVGTILAASCAFMLPVATAPNAVVFGTGYLEMKDMMKTGVWLNIISIIIITLFIYFIMPMLWDLDLSLTPEYFKSNFNN